MYPNAFHSVPRYIPQDRPDDNGPGRTTADACLSQVVVYVDISGRSWTPLVLDVAEGESARSLGEFYSTPFLPTTQHTISAAVSASNGRKGIPAAWRAVSHPSYSPS